ncbi:hypothetical protein AGOR_G00179210 [Albula goreensis]|uniref:Uncharacterized protein n=1 Tax=Albula goreensis TaxID=1534307 RepID=A0A8T3D3L6_9TELE|nr:hypothetical protein AGOR_G00179210 [Albula goreensis]
MWINDVKPTDSGTYWCRMDKCTAMQLHVHKETSHRRKVTPLPHKDHSTVTPLPHKDHSENLLPLKDHSETTIHHSNSSVTPLPPVLFLSVGLAVSVLLLGLGLFILLRHRNRTKHAPVAAPSSNRMNTDTGNTGGDNFVYEEVVDLNQQPDADAAVTTIGSSFSLQEQPPESLYYTSISFPNSTTLTPDSTDYSTVQFHLPPPESGLYSTVTHPNPSVSNT